MLVEAQLPARPDHTEELAQPTPLVRNGAQHEGDHAGIEGPVLARKILGHAVEDADRDGRRRRGLLGSASEVTFGLGGHNALYGAWVVGEVRPLTGARLDNPTGEALEEHAAVLACASPHRDRRDNVQSHTCTRTGDGIVVVAVWHSEEDFRQMMDDPEFRKNVEAAAWPTKPKVTDVYEVHATTP